MSTKARIWPGDGDPRHGTDNGYTNLRCPCDDCRAAHTEYFRTVTRPRLRAKGLIADDPRHGTYNAYTNYGCRCPRCIAANTEYTRDYVKRMRQLVEDGLR
jgi:hypothetical protein